MFWKFVFFFVASQLIGINAQCTGDAQLDGPFEECLYAEEANHDKADLLSILQPSAKRAAEELGATSEEATAPEGDDVEKKIEVEKRLDETQTADVDEAKESKLEAAKTRKVSKSSDSSKRKRRFHSASSDSPAKKRRRQNSKGKRSKAEDETDSAVTDEAVEKVQEILAKLPVEERMMLVGLKKRRKAGSSSRKHMYYEDPYMDGQTVDDYEEMVALPERKPRGKLYFDPYASGLGAAVGSAGSASPNRNKNVNININSRKKKGFYRGQ